MVAVGHFSVPNDPIFTNEAGKSRNSMNVKSNSSLYYAPLNGLIWASSATINHHFYVFGGVESNNENEVSTKDRV